MFWLQQQSRTVTTKPTVKNNTSYNKLKEKTPLKNKTAFAIYTWLKQMAILKVLQLLSAAFQVVNSQLARKYTI